MNISDMIREFIMWIFFHLPMAFQDFFRKFEKTITEALALWI